ncbi:MULTISPECIES: tRNA epoxyqueuosine(34) reductase QueG [Thalassospira]|uniref:Epoxyqueuosine reductase n=2 Tax=Thalassospira TaxID=168934 RepID=A0A367WCU6_9PROT|nr:MULTISPECIES: tRNA epoxyqueuosine(34) reductase QueG [Thalassospira]MDG4719911.1 tRNA epoxyqueuosine(34) reductase QueG [Thalassospira sp. FZY0004]RCK38352.1 4Fe-4S ferredoxin [Thalassospira profundimaris]
MKAKTRQILTFEMLEAKAREIGFDVCGVARPQIDPRNQQRLDEFVAAGEYGSMAWMNDPERLPRRRDPEMLWPDVKSVIVLGSNYGPAENPMALLDHPDRAMISVYARNKDYHDLIKKRLKQLARWLVEQSGGTEQVKVFVDTAPVLEKPLGQSSGIGWQGKHTNLVSREFGSWLFLGEVFTTIEFSEATPEIDHCGSCSKCLSACPTNAFPAPYKLDARKCISYLTIEHDGPIPHEFRTAMGNRIYGCDDCLAACPWNKFASRTEELAFIARDELTAPKLADFLDLDDDGFRAFFAGSPIKRIGRAKFLRNVLIAAGNSGSDQLVPKITALLGDEHALIRASAVWALSQLLGGDAFDQARKDHLVSEQDPVVTKEWNRVLPIS